MKNLGIWCYRHWWQLVVFISVAVVVIVALYGNNNDVRKIEIIGDALSQIITPLCALLGIVLGYPLLKKKLVDGYITKQFDIIHSANREVRKRCQVLRQKYRPKYISTPLTKEYIDEAAEDIKTLMDIAIDACPNAYAYTTIINDALYYAQEECKNGIPAYNNMSHCESLAAWLHYHLGQIQKYSSSIGVVPTNDIKKRQILNDRIDAFVTDNYYYEIEDMTTKPTVAHNSAMLVVFFSLSNQHLTTNDYMLMEACFKAAPTPCAFARMMYNRCIYIPLTLEGEPIMGIFHKELILVGFQRRKAAQIGSGETSVNYVCTYANIVECSYCSTINKENIISDFTDSYLEIPNCLKELKSFSKHGETIQLSITEEEAMKNYEAVASKLQDKLKSEQV